MQARGAGGSEITERTVKEGRRGGKCRSHAGKGRGFDFPGRMPCFRCAQGIYWYTDSGADLAARNATLLRTDFLFASPVDGYISTTDDAVGQEEEFRAFCRDMMGVLDEAQGDGLRVVYGGDVMTEVEITMVRSEVAEGKRCLAGERDAEG